MSPAVKTLPTIPLNINPYESPSESACEATAWASLFGMKPWVGAWIGFFSGGLVGFFIFIECGNGIEIYVVPRMFDPNKAFISYGQYFALGVGPIAALASAISGAVIGAALCRRCRIRRKLLNGNMIFLLGFAFTWSAALVRNPRQGVVVTNGAMVITLLIWLLFVASTSLFVGKFTADPNSDI